MVEVKVRIDRGANGDFADHFVGVYLKGSAHGCLKPFNQERRVASDDETTVRAGL